MRKIVCDKCGKDFPEAETYYVRFWHRANKMGSVHDLCHNCFMKTTQIHNHACPAGDNDHGNMIMHWEQPQKRNYNN